MSSSTFRYLMLAYVAGNALTYQQLVKADPGHALETGTMFVNLLLSCVWPLYWLLKTIP